jgi:hypothetical protein
VPPTISAVATFGEQREAHLAPRDAAQLGDALVVEPVVARAEEADEVERAHLLGRVAAREEAGEIAALAVVRRHPEREAVDRLAAVRRHQPRGHDHEQRQRREQRLERQQRDERSGGAGDRGADGAEPEHDHRRAPDARLRARHAIVERGLVERRQLDGTRDVEDAVLRVARRQLRQQLLLLAPDSRRDADQRGHNGQRDDASHEVAEAAAGSVSGEHVRERALAEQDDGGDADARDDLQRGGDQRLAAARRPDDPDRGRDEPRQLARGALAIGLVEVVDREAAHTVA